MAGAKKGKEAAKKDTSAKAESSTSKGKGKGKSEARGSGDGKVKGAQSINVRHILVRNIYPFPMMGVVRDGQAEEEKWALGEYAGSEYADG